MIQHGTRELASLDTSGRIVAGDPRVGPSSGGRLRVVPGRWHARAEWVRFDDPRLGERVAALTIRHEAAADAGSWHEAPVDVAVDSGRAGFWPPGTDGIDVSAGWGDGCYPCEIQRDASGEIIAARLVFLAGEVYARAPVEPSHPSDLRMMEIRAARGRRLLSARIATLAAVGF